MWGLLPTAGYNTSYNKSTESEMLISGMSFPFFYEYFMLPLNFLLVQHRN